VKKMNDYEEEMKVVWNPECRNEPVCGKFKYPEAGFVDLLLTVACLILESIIFAMSFTIFVYLTCSVMK